MLSIRPLILLVCLLSPSLSGQVDPSTLPAQILQRYERAMPALSAYRQGHFALRMYRATGEKKYLPFIETTARRLVRKLKANVRGMGDPEYVLDYLDAMKAGLRNNPKGRLRKASLSSGSWPMFFTRGIAYPLLRLQELGIAVPEKEALIAFLKTIDFKRRLLTPENLRVWTAPTVNWVYWLHQLGVIDLREDLKNVFQEAFPPNIAVSDAAFVNHIYGLTHFILAASGYYQWHVPSTPHQWILDFFEANRKRLFAIDNPDMLAEVGLNFLLAGQANHPLVKATRLAVAKHFSESHGMLLGLESSPDPERAEHRNVLAYLLFALPNRLHPGPYLNAPF